MPTRIPLPTLLSHVLVAFTISLDNEFEQQMPHTTTMALKGGEPVKGPWLVSLAMWANFMRFVGPEGITVAELEQATFGDTDIRGANPGMVRWGYVRLGPAMADARAQPPRRDWLVHATTAGRRAQEIWCRLPGVIEARWADRFGPKAIAALRRSLGAVVSQIKVELPDYLPINAALSGRVRLDPRPLAVPVAADADLSALVAKVLIAFTMDFEGTHPLSLAHAANPVRALLEGTATVRDLPQATGVAKETLAVMLGQLQRRGFVEIDAVSRTKTVRLTEPGRQAGLAYHERVATIEDEWRVRYGPDVASVLRGSLESLVGDSLRPTSPLLELITPPPTGWRAKAARPEVLPHHPVVSHRGGYPDGS